MVTIKHLIAVNEQMVQAFERNTFNRRMAKISNKL
jgi:hypothetical protein